MIHPINSQGLITDDIFSALCLCPQSLRCCQCSSSPSMPRPTTRNQSPLPAWPPDLQTPWSHGTGTFYFLNTERWSLTYSSERHWTGKHPALENDEGWRYTQVDLHTFIRFYPKPRLAMMNHDDLLRFSLNSVSVVGRWCWAISSVLHLLSNSSQKSWLYVKALCRPVKFFHNGLFDYGPGSVFMDKFWNNIDYSII